MCVQRGIYELKLIIKLIINICHPIQSCKRFLCAIKSDATTVGRHPASQPAVAAAASSSAGGVLMMMSIVNPKVLLKEIRTLVSLRSLKTNNGHEGDQLNRREEKEAGGP